MTRCKVFALGLAFLVLGAGFYSVPAHSSSFDSRILPLLVQARAYLPDFLHPLGMSLLGMALLCSTPRCRLSLCVYWVIVNCMFELGQWKQGALLGELATRPSLGWITDYFREGTFDPLDMLLFALGGGCAFLLGNALFEKHGCTRIRTEEGQGC